MDRGMKSLKPSFRSVVLCALIGFPAGYPRSIGHVALLGEGSPHMHEVQCPHPLSV
jgi:hypothetical protein